MAIAERRRAARKPAKFVVKFRVPGDVAERLGRVLDVSTTGLSIDTKRPVAEGAALELKLPESPFGPARTLKGRVCWTSEGPEPGDFRFGVGFETAAKPASARPDERRRFPRRTEKLLLRVKCVSKGVFHEIEPRGAMLADISKGGMEFTTTRDYAPGCLVEVVLPESPLGPPRTLHARIVWARPHPEKPSQYALGCSFVRLAAPPPADGL